MTAVQGGLKLLLQLTEQKWGVSTGGSGVCEVSWYAALSLCMLRTKPEGELQVWRRAPRETVWHLIAEQPASHIKRDVYRPRRLS